MGGGTNLFYRRFGRDEPNGRGLSAVEFEQLPDLENECMADAESAKMNENTAKAREWAVALPWTNWH